jgi:putative membrane protein
VTAPIDDPRVFLAEERTLLAWIRTGLALMGFGFVVARFGLFLRELSVLPGITVAPDRVLSAPLGTALVLLGVAVQALAIVRHLQRVRDYRAGRPSWERPSRLGIAVAVLLALTGTVMAIHLLAQAAGGPAASTSGEHH